MASSAFRFYELKIKAKRLPGGGLKCDPLAVVYTGGPGQWSEIGRTERLLNEWNPQFAKAITLPGDSDAQKRQQIRVDFYNKKMEESRFLGTVEVNFGALIMSQGRSVELVLQTPEQDNTSPRVFLTANEGINPISDNLSQLHLSFQLMQTNYYGVSMKIFYEIARAGNAQWDVVHKSETIRIDEQGWGQFPTSKISLKQLCMNEESRGLLITLYRDKQIFGKKRVLGMFQTNVTELSRKHQGEFISFQANTKEDILAADIQVLHTQKVGTIYEVGLKLINVHWNATALQPENM